MNNLPELYTGNLKRYEEALKTAVVHGQTCTRTRITAESISKECYTNKAPDNALGSPGPLVGSQQSQQRGLEC